MPFDKSSSDESKIVFFDDKRQGPFDYWWECTSPLYDTAPAASPANTAANSKTLSENVEAIAEHEAELETINTTVNKNQTRIAQSETAIAENTAAINQQQAQFEQLDLTVDALSLQLAHTQETVDANTAGIAIANALAGSTWLQSNERFALSANWGHYEGRSAIAISGAARLGRNLSANAAIGTDPKRGALGARAGLRLGW